MEFKEGTKKEKGVLECLLYFLRYPIKSVQKAMSYDYLSNQHTNTINEISKLYGEIKALKEKEGVQEKNVVNLASERDSLKSKVDELTEDIGKYKKSVLESLEYKTLEEEKEKIDAVLTNRNTLIDLLKADKQTLIGLSKQIIKKIPYFSIEALKEDSEYAKKPYVFIDAEGIVLGYTDGIKKEIEEISSGLIGESYLRVLEEGCKCAEKKVIDLSEIKRIRKFFDVNEEKIFDIKIQRENETIEFHIVKKHPVFHKNFEPLNLGILGEKIETNKIAYVPLLVERLSGIRKRFHHKHSLDEVMEKTEEELKLAEEAEKETPKVHTGLIKYGWKADGILKIENKMGPIQSYLYFKKTLYELEAKEKKQKEQEEIKRKAERKIEARKRLKRAKAERKKREEKRDKIIKSFGKTYKVKKEDMIKIWDESKNFSDFIYRCRETSRPYRTKQEPQETKPI